MLAPAVGVFLVLGIVILIVRRSKRYNMIILYLYINPKGFFVKHRFASNFFK